MLVQCPKCKTTYKVADNILKGAAPVFRCSRCKYTFDLDWQEPIAPLAENSRRAGAFIHTKEDDRELSFSFSPRTTTPGPDDAGDIAKAESFPEGGDSRIADRWSMSSEAPAADEPFTISEARDSRRKIAADDPAPLSRKDDLIFPPIAPRQESSNNIVPFNSYREQQVSTLPFLSVLALLVVLYSLLTAFQQVNPSASEGWLKTVPLLGDAILKNNHLKNGVLLQSLHASYQNIQGNREVFVLTGIALNRNAVIIREVRVTGQVFNQEGKEIEQQTIWLGNAISPKIVRGMTIQDIANLQRLKSLKRFEIPPGDSVPFTIVFLKPTRGIKDFSCAIVSAEGSA